MFGNLLNCAAVFLLSSTRDYAEDDINYVERQAEYRRKRDEEETNKLMARLMRDLDEIKLEPTVVA